MSVQDAVTKLTAELESARERIREADDAMYSARQELRLCERKIGKTLREIDDIITEHREREEAPNEKNEPEVESGRGLFS